MGRDPTTNAASGASTAPYRLHCWGEFELLDARGRIVSPRGRKARALVAFLASRPDVPVPRERLAELLWGDRAEEQARASLRQTIYELNPLHGGPGRLLDVTRDDVALRSAALRNGNSHPEEAGSPERLQALAQIIANGEGVLFSDLDDVSDSFDQWLWAERARRRSDLVSTALEHAEAGLEKGEVKSARLLIDRLESIDPLDEAVARLGMLADARASENAAAELRYKRLCEGLKKDLGVEPSESTRKLHDRLVPHEPGPVVPNEGREPDPTSRPADKEPGGEPPPPGMPTARNAAEGSSNITRLVAAAIVLAAVAASILLLPVRSPGPPSIAVLAAPSVGNDARTQELVRDLQIDLMRFTDRAAGAFRLVPEGAQEDAVPAEAEYRLYVSDSSDSGSRAADVMLLSSADEHLLWSFRFESPDLSGPLHEQVAVRTADVLLCGFGKDGMDVAGLDSTSMALLLKACDRKHDGFNRVDGFDRTTVELLRQLTAREPQFARGWLHLALAEVAALNSNLPQGAERDRLQASARAHLRRARQLAPNQAEAFVAEAELAPPDAFGTRLALYERGILLDPNSALLHGGRAGELWRTGKIRDAIDSARRAVALEPNCPLYRHRLVTLLAYTGRFEAAQEELKEAERLWPGSPAVRDIRYRIDLRYGDAERAFAALQASSVSDAALEVWRRYLQARINPTEQRIREAVEEARLFFARQTAQRQVGVLPMHVQFLVHLGRTDEAFGSVAGRTAHPRVREDPTIFFRVHMRPMQRDRRFMGVAADLGLAQYWLGSGNWPDFCADPRLPYDCRTEAARAVRSGLART